MTPFARAAALALAALPLAACAETRTIREYGFPAFEEVLGPTTRFTRADEREVEGLNVLGPESISGAHKIRMMITPLGTEQEVMLEVRAISKEESVAKVVTIAVSAHPLTFPQIAAYRRTGVLPGADAPLAVQASSAVAEDGVVKLMFHIPRASVPAGTERLAMPILVRYGDGWAYVRFYETGVPAAVPELELPGGALPPPGSAPPGSAPAGH